MLYTNPWHELLWKNAPLPFFEKLLALGKAVEPEFGNGLYESPLVQAIKHNNYEIVVFLISKGADVNREHQNKETPLHFAASAEDTRILRRLIEAGAAVNKPDELGYTPLHRATRQKEKIEILLAHGANINAVNTRGLTPLMIAVSNPSCTRETVQTLLAGRPNINATDPSRQSALILAAKNTSRPEIITLLLNAGANAKLEDNTGRTALDWFDQNRRIYQSPVRKELKDKT
jgi:ankyrin repeat protein